MILGYTVGKKVNEGAATPAVLTCRVSGCLFNGSHFQAIMSVAKDRPYINVDQKR